MQHLYWFIDDSGVFHKNEKSKRFVYAGFVFLDKKEKENAKRKYLNANRKIAKELDYREELKACNLLPKHRRSLFNVVSKYESLSVAVDLAKVYPQILSNKHSICRYKDYALKRAVKAKMIDLIEKGLVDPDQPIEMDFHIDEQATATNGVYAFSPSVFEELVNGIYSYNYDVIHKPILRGTLNISTHYCDSKHNYLVQASDILANRVWQSYCFDKENMREINDHMHLTLP